MLHRDRRGQPIRSTVDELRSIRGGDVLEHDPQAGKPANDGDESIVPTASAVDRRNGRAAICYEPDLCPESPSADLLSIPFS